MKKMQWLILSLLAISTNYSSAQWAITNYTESSMGLMGLHFVNDNVGFVAGYHKAMRTLDGGATWNSITPATNLFINGPVDVRFFSSTVGFVIGHDGGSNPQVAKTINGGTSWNLINLYVTQFGSMKSPNRIYFYDQNLGFIVCRSGLIFKTTDQGVNWSLVNSTTTEDLTDIHFPSANVGYASTAYTDYILKSTDSGSTWNKVYLPSTVEVNSIYFTSEQKGFLVSNASRIFTTLDGGATWSMTNFGSSDTFYGITFSNSNNGYIVGSSGTIVTTNDGGTTWNPGASGSSQLVYRVAFPSPNVGYFATLASYGEVWKTTNAGGITAVEELSGYTLGVTLFPNPASKFINISFDADSTVLKSNQTSISIFNIMGQEVFAKNIENSKETIATSHLSPGVYIIMIKNKFGKTRSERFIVTH